MKLERESLYIGFIGSILGALLGSIATITTSGFGYLNTDREQDIKMIDIGLSILNGEKTENSMPARDFAVSILERYAGVEIKYRDQWVENGDVPYSVVLMNSLTNEQSREVQKCVLESLLTPEECREKLGYGVTAMRGSIEE